MNIPVLQDRLTIGRSPKSDIVFDDPYVSKLHLVAVRKPDGGLTITDMLTTNGTMLDNVPLTPTMPTEWTVGQTAVIGHTQLSLWCCTNEGEFGRAAFVVEVGDAGRITLPPDSLPIGLTNQPKLATKPSETEHFASEAVRSAVQISIGVAKSTPSTLGIRRIPDGRSILIAIIYLAYLNTAQVLTYFVDPRIGLALFSSILLLLFFYIAVNWGDSTHKLLLSLTLIPVIRLLDLSFPLVGPSIVYRYLFISIPVFLTVLLIARTLQLSLRELGLTANDLPIQILVGSTGILFGFLQFLLLRPDPLVQAFNWGDFLLVAVMLFLSTSLVEELAFRGVIQLTAVNSLGRLGGIVYVASLYAVLQFGHNSWLNAFVVFGIALFYGWIVSRTRSIIGVALSHGLTNIVLFMVLPLIVSTSGG